MSLEKKRLLRFLALAALMIIILISVPNLIGLSRAGFDSEEILKQFFFYGVTGIGSLLGIILLFFYENREKEGDPDYGSGLAFSSPGEKPSIPFFKRFTQFQIFFASFIIFNTLGLFSYISRQVSFTGIATLSQQFTEIDSLLFSSFLIPVAENLGLMFLIAFGIFGIRYYARKHDWQTSSFIGVSYLLIIMGGLFGVANHLLRYSGSDIQLIIVFFFWAIGTAITLFTGSFLPFLIMHFANNFWFDLGRFLSNELLLLYGGSVIVILAIGYFIMYSGRLLGRKQ